MPTIGEILKSAREAKGLALSDAGQATRIKTQQLDALERDDYRTIPAAPYARGFIKLYAQFLNLDPAPLLEQYNVRHGKASLPPAPTPTTPTRPRPPVRPATPAVSAAVRPSTPAAEPKPPAPPPPALAVPAEPPPPAAPAEELPLFEPPAPFPAPLPDPVEAPVLAPPRVAEAPASVPSFTPLVEPAAPAAPEPEPEPELRLESPEAPRAPAESARRGRAPTGVKDRNEAARNADRELRIRQAVIVAASVLAVLLVLWLVRSLLRGSGAVDAEAAVRAARAEGRIAPAPEPYLDGR